MGKYQEIIKDLVELSEELTKLGENIVVMGLEQTTIVKELAGAKKDLLIMQLVVGILGLLWAIGSFIIISWRDKKKDKAVAKLVDRQKIKYLWWPMRPNPQKVQKSPKSLKLPHVQKFELGLESTTNR